MTEREIESTIDHLDRIKQELLTTTEVVDVAVIAWRRRDFRDPRETGESRETFTTNSARLSSAAEILEGGL